MSTTSHVIDAPVFLHGFRIAQFVVALIILGLAAYGVTFWAFDGDSLILFTALATMIIVVYNGVSALVLPVAYNYWAILGLDIFAVVFWVISFPLLASEVGDYTVVTDDCVYEFDGYCYKKRWLSLEKRDTTNPTTYRNAMAAAAGLGGLEFILFIVTLVVFSIHLHRHRKSGGHCTPARNANAGAVTTEPKGVELQNPQNAQQNASPGIVNVTQVPQQYPAQQYPVQQEQEYPVQQTPIQQYQGQQNPMQQNPVQIHQEYQATV